MPVPFRELALFALLTNSGATFSFPRAEVVAEVAAAVLAAEVLPLELA
jgi:hypothetical protein